MLFLINMGNSTEKVNELSAIQRIESAINQLHQKHQQDQKSIQLYKEACVKANDELKMHIKRLNTILELDHAEG